jgi:hypothetical protein
MTKFYVIMQKRSNGKVYADLHKTTSVIYLNKEDADRALEQYEDKSYYHVVPMLAQVDDSENVLTNKEEVEQDHIQLLIGLIKKPEFYVPRYQPIGGFWAVDTWKRGGVTYQLMDEGYTNVISTDGLKVIEGYYNGENYIRYEKGNEQMVNALIKKFQKE